MYKVKQYLKNSSYTKPLYEKYHLWKQEKDKREKLTFHGRFTDRSKGYSILCIVLAGYKPFLYESVFGRIEKYIEGDIDVCVITSGLFSAEIYEKCEKNNWSYLETKENNVCLVQNVAINLHPNAHFVFKLDEDIFITENFFKNMLAAYNHASEGEYCPGVLAPILPINGYGYVRVLEKMKILDEYENRFGKIKVAASSKAMGIAPIEQSIEIAKFFWGDGDFVPSIDEMNRRVSGEVLQEFPCAIRFSIGAILFERKLWEDMGFFDVDLTKKALGEDEVQLCKFCCLNSRPIMVSENVIVGHFSFGSQTEGMREFLAEHPEKFSIIS